MTALGTQRQIRIVIPDRCFRIKADLRPASPACRFGAN